MDDPFQISISSPPDREKLVAEILFNGVQWAEINKEHGRFEIEFHPRPDRRPWRLDYKVAIRALENAKQRLSEIDDSP